MATANLCLMFLTNSSTCPVSGLVSTRYEDAPADRQFLAEALPAPAVGCEWKVFSRATDSEGWYVLYATQVREDSEDKTVTAPRGEAQLAFFRMVNSEPTDVQPTEAMTEAMEPGSMLMVTSKGRSKNGKGKPMWSLWIGEPAPLVPISFV